VSLLILVGVYVVGALGYAIIEGRSLFDAAYMATITISTVGYGEHIQLDKAGRIWTVFFIMFGVAGAAYASTSLITLFISGEFKELFGRRKVQAQIERLKGHTILCGYGRMGALTADRLKRHGSTVVVVERDPAKCDKLGDEGMLFVRGDATEESVLLQAGLMQSEALVAVLPHDSDNVYTTLTARGIRPNMTIIARAELPTTEPKLRRAGATRVICPQVVGASKVAAILTRPNVVDFLEVADTGLELEVDEYEIDPAGPLSDQTLRDAPIRSSGAIVVAIKRRNGETIYHPDPGEYIRPGDTLIVIGRAGVSTRLRELEQSPDAV
jgi:voltage-gated potassium channel